MKNPVKLLEILLTRWAWASRQNKVCQAAFMAHYRIKDKFMADLIQAVMMHAGDWRAAAETMQSRFPDTTSRLMDFQKWAAKITAPKKRGLLLEWKGGAR